MSLPRETMRLGKVAIVFLSVENGNADKRGGVDQWEDTL
jgi:hypothetical protein